MDSIARVPSTQIDRDPSPSIAVESSSRTQCLADLYPGTDTACSQSLRGWPPTSCWRCAVLRPSDGGAHARASSSHYDGLLPTSDRPHDDRPGVSYERSHPSAVDIVYKDRVPDQRKEIRMSSIENVGIDQERYGSSSVVSHDRIVKVGSVRSQAGQRRTAPPRRRPHP